MHLDMEWECQSGAVRKARKVSLSLDTYDMDTLTTAQIILKLNATPEQRCDQEEETYQALRHLPDTEVDEALSWALKQQDSTMHWFVLPLIGNYYQDRPKLVPFVRSCLKSDNPLVATAAIACLTNLRDESSDTEFIVRDLHNSLTSPWSKVVALGHLLLCHGCKDTKAKLQELAYSDDVIHDVARKFLNDFVEKPN